MLFGNFGKIVSCPPPPLPPWRADTLCGESWIRNIHGHVELKSLNIVKGGDNSVRPHIICPLSEAAAIRLLSGNQLLGIHFGQSKILISAKQRRIQNSPVGALPLKQGRQTYILAKISHKPGMFLNTIDPIGGTKGARGMHAPSGSKFRAVFGKISQNRMLAPPGGLVPPPEGNSGSTTGSVTMLIPFTRFCW